MRVITHQQIIECVSELCMRAACELPNDVKESLCRSVELEKTPMAASILRDCVENAEIAEKEKIPICQDTGVAVYFIELGRKVRLDCDLYSAISIGTAQGYKNAYLRNSIVSDPLFRRINTTDNTPPVIHLELVPGDKLRITLAPKGGGSENMSALAMLKPSDGKNGLRDFVVKTVVEAGGNPCPPVIVGVGIGGTFEKTALLAKKSLLREIGTPHPEADYAALEGEILEMLNNSGVGAQGLGGDITALAVHIEYFPCHIASLPVAVNLNCHAARHKTAFI